MSIYLQILINSIISGLLLSLVAIGFTYIYQITKVFHLAHAGVLVAGAYSYLFFLNRLDSVFISLLLSIFLISILSVLIEKLVYLPISENKVNQAISLISSMGVYIIIINMISIIFGSENQTLPSNISNVNTFGKIIITDIQFLQLVISILILILSTLFLYFSKLNLKFRAIADHKVLSEVFGFNIRKNRVIVIVFGSLLSLVAAVLITYEIGIEPHSGMGITLSAVVVAILVSRLEISWLIAFSILLVVFQNLTEWFLNAQWKQGMTYLILLLVLLLKKDGLISYNLRKDTV